MEEEKRQEVESGKTTTVDARGRACPQPVIMAKQAIEENERITVLVDNAPAVENIRRLAVRTACGFVVTEKEGGFWEIVLTRTGPIEAGSGDSAPAGTGDELLSCAADGDQRKVALVVALSDDHMGRGDETLGNILIRSFVHTLLELKPRPATVICYNAGVKLALKDSPALDDLQALEKSGTEILVCGTCANYFGVTDQVAVGHISNMYDIVETLAGAGRVVRP